MQLYQDVVVKAGEANSALERRNCQRRKKLRSLRLMRFFATALFGPLPAQDTDWVDARPLKHSLERLLAHWKAAQICCRRYQVP